MRKLVKAMIVWLFHPRSMICAALGLFAGVLLKFPTGWSLPDSTASLIGAFAGAGAAVGGALWAANAKQRQEDEMFARRAELKLHTLQCSVADALYADLRTAKTMCESQLDQAAAIKAAPKEVQLMWCQRIAGLPLVAFDRLGYLLMDLGDISGSLIFIQAQVSRVSALVRSEAEKPERYRNYAVMVDVIAGNLPAFIQKIATTMEMLMPFVLAGVQQQRSASNGDQAGRLAD